MFASAKNLYISSQEICFVTVTGKDALSFLQGQFSNDLKLLKIGQGQNTSANTPKGKAVCLLEVFCTGTQTYLLLVPRKSQEILLNHLNQFLITEEVLFEIPDMEGFAGRILPEAEIEAEWSQDKISSRLFNAPVEWSISKPDRLMNAEEFEFFRIQSFVPLAGREFQQGETLTPELCQTGIVSYTKGCYVGQEIFARIKTYGRTNRSLALIEFDRSIDAKTLIGRPIFIQESSRGNITSSASNDQKTLALGYLPTQHKSKNQIVLVDHVQGKVLA